MTEENIEYVKFDKDRPVTLEDMELLKLFNSYFHCKMNSVEVFNREAELRSKLQFYSFLDFTITSEVSDAVFEESIPLFKSENIMYAELPSDDFYVKSYFHKTLPSDIGYGVSVSNVY